MLWAQASRLCSGGCALRTNMIFRVVIASIGFTGDATPSPALPPQGERVKPPVFRVISLGAGRRAGKRSASRH